MPALLQDQKIPPYPFKEQVAKEKPPWNRPWWQPGKGELATLIWLVLIHLAAIAGLILYPLPGWPVFWGAVALAWLGGLGTTIGYHRTLAHRGLKLHPLVKHVLIFLAMFNGSGAPVSWVANHRLHHAKSDTEEDISSPGMGGFGWAHLRWLWQAPPTPVSRYCPDIDTPEFQRWTKWQPVILFLSFFGALLISPAAFFWLGAIRLVYSLHAQCFVNSVSHMAKVPPGEDSSRNVFWLGFMQTFQGENWHKNHHANPASARFGWKFWQIDSGWWIIVMLRQCRLASAVRARR